MGLTIQGIFSEQVLDFELILGHARLGLGALKGRQQLALPIHFI